MVDWDGLVREHGKVVFGIAWRILGHAQDAEDVAQEVFCQAAAKSNSKPVACWPALLRRMATCRAIDVLRRRRAMFSLDAVDPAVENDGPVAIAVREELQTRLRLALARLTSREAEVFCLRYFEDLSYRQIAETLGISTSAASTALHQARMRLQEVLAEPDEGGVS
ncbi:MAG TPA: hypothetical protein DD670_15410 [Planctomycetaceae bacterium]|nr:hypothetical protein [Planctomycetaceae bacterium]